MRLYVLFAQRSGETGDYCPEALAVADELTQDGNPDYMAGELEKARADSDIWNAEVFEIVLPRNTAARIRKRLGEPERLTGLLMIPPRSTEGAADGE